MYFIYITKFSSIIIVDSLRKEKFLVGNNLYSLPYVNIPSKITHIEVDKDEFIFIKNNYQIFL